jgi:hypothetical protein
MVIDVVDFAKSVDARPAAHGASLLSIDTTDVGAKEFASEGGCDP